MACFIAIAGWVIDIHVPGVTTGHVTCMSIEACLIVCSFNTLRLRQNGYQTTFSNAFSWMKMYEFLLRFDWRLLLRVQLTIFHHWFRQWLGASQATSHCLNQWWLVYWCIYASLGLNELRNVEVCVFHAFIDSGNLCLDSTTRQCYEQSGTKPNLVAKILATKFGIVFVIHVMLSKICSI